MFQFARQSAKAVLVAAGAAGVAALGAGSAGADDLGALSATDSLAPQSSPVQTSLPAGLGGGASSLVAKAKEADLRNAQPAPSTVNLGTPAGDMSPVGPQAQAQLDTVHDALDRARHTVGLGSGVVPQAAPVDGVGTTLPAGMPSTEALPLGQLTNLLGGGQTLPLREGTVPQAAPVDGVGTTLPAGMPSTEALPLGQLTNLLGGGQTLPLREGTVPQAAPVDGVGTTLPAGMPSTEALPLGQLTNLLGGGQTLPLREGTVPQAAPVDGVGTTLPAQGVVPSQGGPAGMLPTSGVTDLLGGGGLLPGMPGGATETLPLRNELPTPASVEGSPSEIAGEAVGTAVEQSAGAVLPNTTEETGRLAGELPAPSTGSVEEQLPEAPISVEGADTEAVESAVPGAEQVGGAADADTVKQEAPSLDEVTEQVDTGEAAGDVAEAAAGGAGATGVVDVVQGVGTPAL
ncbi:hypothetical protein [Streptomonospora litoralis]|uniref:Uncharacterized protein n=1 Tax=Streptomonospora litoralis TaxID=2498135 RepID=A0A4P6Q798_9ACTN|nr:hypothetical protein [Streptomonospora litoralis]QBI56573.1 hypothetical protein EKD16_24140 [Streptomonospora litoralis]